MLRLSSIIGYVFLSLVILSIYSCGNRKELVYFQSDSTLLKNTFELSVPKLQTGDILAISVNADDVRATAPFNPISPYQGSTGNIQTSSIFVPTYTIDIDGNIDFPMIGEVKLEGLTRTEAIDYLRKKVQVYINQPRISLEIRNFKVTVLGEVNNPGSFPVTNDRITILEALGLAGDLTINGVRNNILVIREINGKKDEIRIDLTKRESLNSPAYYLMQNDVVYVEPNNARIQSSKYTQNTSIFVSIAGLIITIIAVIVK
ncbi:polysaccharide biosynthesis/export family protein [Sphingobacterium sp. BN32]|uniref:polysaccharide biosynthesis/export family protein n=1 Tax=Sphingobacterium sp. BN32 TaxID=3058432 RepID=UPI00265D488D|nr:polysaccharide biosynthesis/export family protein [Sphingobacterium sp. BN32]WKK58397.1 polysaccharide biosynthesis/export family protein [Sphingobacterium sp. BN32]